MTRRAPQLYHFAQIAEAAYREDAAPFHGFGFERARLVSRQGAQCWVLENNTQLVFAFRGTEFDQSSDIKASLRFALRPAMTRRHDQGAADRAAYAPGRVHRGFARELSKIHHSEALELPAQNGRQVYFCGHSMGGAMALLAAGRWRVNYQPEAVVSFGAPRLGDAAFVAGLRLYHWRVVHGADRVPHLPFWLLGYRHHSAAISIGQNKWPHGMFSDHRMKRYLAALATHPENGAAGAQQTQPQQSL